MAHQPQQPIWNSIKVLELARDATQAVAELQDYVRSGVRVGGSNDKLTIEGVELLLPLMPPVAANLTREVIAELRNSRDAKLLR
jgi:hypothetical protein